MMRVFTTVPLINRSQVKEKEKVKEKVKVKVKVASRLHERCSAVHAAAGTWSCLAELRWVSQLFPPQSINNIP